MSTKYTLVTAHVGLGGDLEDHAVYEPVSFIFNKPITTKVWSVDDPDGVIKSKTIQVQATNIYGTQDRLVEVMSQHAIALVAGMTRGDEDQGAEYDRLMAKYHTPVFGVWGAPDKA